MANGLKHYQDDYILFLEAGFIAVNQADENSALKLFRAAAALQPKNTLPKVGFGYLHLHKLELKQAIQIFEEVLREEPENDMAKALLGISMGLTPNQMDKGEKILEQAAKSKDSGIQKLSHMAISFVDQFMKKSPGPAGKNK